MPMKFALVQSQGVRDHAQNAVDHLQKHGQDRIADVALVPSGRTLMIPWDTTFLLMGTSSELEAELGGVQAGGKASFTVDLDDEDALMTKVASRKWTREDAKGVVPHEVSVIALHAGARTFSGSWQGILEKTMGRPRAGIDELLLELPRIRKF